MSASDVLLNPADIDDLLNGDDGPVAKDIARRAVMVERRAKQLCAVDTGRLRASVSHRLGRDSTSLFADIGTNVEYGPYVEFGTRRAPAQPFLVPALAAGADQ